MVLLDQDPFDCTIYYALADLAEEEGLTERARAWRVLAWYKAVPYREVSLSVKVTQFAFLHSETIHEFTCSKGETSWGSYEQNYTAITQAQSVRWLGPRFFTTRREPILRLVQLIVEHPKEFGKELSRV